MSPKNDAIRRFVSSFNEGVNKLLVGPGVVHRYGEKDSSGGMYSPYIRATYKAACAAEIAHLKEYYGQEQEKYFSLLRDAKQPLKTYKNHPLFVNEPVLAITLKKNPAYQSKRYKTSSNTAICICSFYFDEDEDDEIGTLEGLAREQANSVERKLNRLIRNVDVKANSSSFDVWIPVFEIANLAKQQEHIFESITVRRETGQKYNARVLFSSSKDKSIETKYGLIIVHPDSELSDNSIYNALPRAKSHRSLELMSTKFDKVGDVKITAQIWLNP